MKLLLSILLINLGASLSIAQTDKINLEKYWKFRNDFVQKFVKIGAESGESLPANSIGPRECWDNDPNDGTTNFAWDYGNMSWGDGMIYHGHYLSFLATEYALRKKEGLDTVGVLYELYYALNAINRLDVSAEPSLDDVYNSPSFYGNTNNLNGFYLRDDVPENFALLWETDEMTPKCTNGDFYSNNNVAKVHNPSTSLITNPTTSNRNVPSLDQMSSLMVGLAMVDKLVENVFIKPNPLTDQGFYIVDETEAIVDRMVSYAANHNWFLIDVNGWAVPNGGGDLALSAFPLLKAATIITGKNYDDYNLTLHRRITSKLERIQHCVTGYGLDKGPSLQQVACDDVLDSNPLTIIQYLLLDDGGDLGIDNNQDSSVFQFFEESGVELDPLLTSPFWSSSMANSYPLVYADWQDDHKFALLPLPYSLLTFNDLNLSHYNNTIYFNLGVMSRLWNSNQASVWANTTENHELELINAILRDEGPAKNKSFYQNFLNSMGHEGAYAFKDYYYLDTNYSSQQFQSGGWASSYRWINPEQQNGEIADKGIYAGLDYMLFHNLYYLFFENSLQPFEETYECFCSPEIEIINSPGTIPEQAFVNTAINKKLKFIPTCQPNVFEPVFNLVNGTFDIHPKFHDYADLEIATAKFQTMDATIADGGTANVFSKLIVCNSKTLTIHDGGHLNAVKDDIRIKDGAVIDLYGNIRIDADNELLIRAGGTLVMHPGATLQINDGGRILIEEGGDLEFYDGAEVLSAGEDAEFVLEGTVKMMNGGIFTIDHSASPYSGRFIMDGLYSQFITKNNAPGVAEVHLVGKNRNDEFLIIKENARLLVDYNEVTNIDKLIIHSCLVRLEENTFIKSQKHFNTFNATYTSEHENGGIYVAAFNKFNSVDFKNVNVMAYLHFNDSEKLRMTSCNMVNEPGVNDTPPAMVSVDGMGLHINNSTFLGSNGAILSAKNMLFPSLVSSSTFNQNTSSGNNYATVGIRDYSQSDIKLFDCTFDGLFVAAVKVDGKLTLRCNTFDNSLLYDVAGVDGCMVNASSGDYGGYNYFNSPSATHIHLASSDINIGNGFNYFDKGALTVYGTVPSTCGVNTSCPIDANYNQWGLGLQVPPSSLFNVVGSDQTPFSFLTSNTALISACGTTDPTGPFTDFSPGDSGWVEGHLENAETLSLPIIETSFNSEIRLDHAIMHGRSKMTANNENGDDTEAIDIFDEILNADFPIKSRTAKNWVNASFSDMKTSLESDLYEKKITGGGKSGTDPNVTKYLNALNFMTDTLVVDSNYVEAFYIELDKAHLFRILGDPTTGLGILENIELCGINLHEQEVLNHWKREYEIDVLVDQLGIAYLDTTITIDTTEYTVPVINTPGQYYFGAVFTSLAEIDYPNCGNARFGSPGNLWEELDIELSVFPNPADQRINITVNYDIDSQSSSLFFYSADGRIVDEVQIANTKGEVTVHSVNSWLPGVYIYELVIDGKNMSRGKLIVE
jgi:hypothetical protein